MKKKQLVLLKKKNPIKLFNNNNSNKTIYLNSKEFKELELFAVNKEYERKKKKKKILIIFYKFQAKKNLNSNKIINN